MGSLLSYPREILMQGRLAEWGNRMLGVRLRSQNLFCDPDDEGN
jgi:hypothetical protein